MPVSRRTLIAFSMLAAPGAAMIRVRGAAAQDATPAAEGEPMKVGFIYVSPAADLGWSYSHDQARLALEEKFPNIETVFQENVPENPADAERVIRQMADDGAKIIFTTSFGYMDPTINVAQDYPDVVFVHISGFKRADNVSTAFGKIEEPRYVSGLVAGKMTKSNKLGYVAAFPIPEVVRGLNAFTLGVREANPEATVQVVWTNTWFDPQKERQAAEALLDAGADVIGQHQDTAGPQQAAEERGAFSVGYHADMGPLAPGAVLTSAVWNWPVFYEQVVQGVMDGTWESTDYWGGWQDGVVDLTEFGAMVPDDVKAMAEEEIAKFESGDATIFTIFTGPLNDNTGAEKVADGVAMTAEELLSMNWLVEGVEGEIPA